MSRRSKRFRLTKSPCGNYFSITIRSKDDEIVEFWGSFKIEQLEDFLKCKIDFTELKRID